MKKVKQCFMVFIALTVFFSLNIYAVHAEDELFLTGILINTDAKSKIITVNVKSESCRGLRKFKVDDVSELSDMVGKKIAFYINSPTCIGDTIYTIHTMAPQRGK